MKTTLLLSIIALSLLTTQTANAQGKEIYIPEELRNMDFESDTAQWSYQRMDTTANFVIFWEKGFGSDLSKAPSLQGTDMTVDLKNLEEKLETFYAYYKDSLKFIMPGSNADQLRMMAMLKYSLDGTAYGGDYDETIGALWIAPNRLKDPNLNAIAHEIGHSFQSQIMSDGAGDCWGGGGIFEMASQWMLWQVNPLWIDDETFHWQAFIKQANLPFLSIENIYHSPYVLEYWSMLHGKTFIAELFRQGRRDEDPAQTYMRLTGIDHIQFAQQLCDAYSRLITFDLPRVRSVCRKYSNQFINDAPLMAYGVNVRQMEISGKKATLHIKPEAHTDGFAYRIVAVDADNNPTYSDIQTQRTLRLTLPEGTTRLYCVVVAYPKDGYTPILHSPRNKDTTPPRTYKYTVH